MAGSGMAASMTVKLWLASEWSLVFGPVTLLRAPTLPMPTNGETTVLPLVPAHVGVNRDPDCVVAKKQAEGFVSENGSLMLLLANVNEMVAPNATKPADSHFFNMIGS